MGVKKIVIPLQEDSDSGEEINDSGTQSVDNFGINLDTFLKEARQTAKTKIVTNPVPKFQKTTMKRNLPPSLKKLNIRAAQRLSSAAKHTLMSSSISHLPQNDQREYKRLKELIAKKEKTKNIKEKDNQENGSLNKIGNASRQTTDSNSEKTRPENSGKTSEQV